MEYIFHFPLGACLALHLAITLEANISLGDASIIFFLTFLNNATGGLVDKEGLIFLRDRKENISRVGV